MEERGVSMLSLGRFNSGGGGAKEIESFLREGISGDEAADVIREPLLTNVDEDTNRVCCSRDDDDDEVEVWLLGD
jgi:hypothetical protein